MMQTAIGQGETLVSPMHMALITAAVANNGVLMKPYLIDRIENDFPVIGAKNTEQYLQKADVFQ